MEEKRFTYVVNPRRPIKGILDMPPIKCSMTLKLTKEEALLAMKSGPVYRKFANEGIQERVTATNIDRLHAEKFMTEREFSGSNIPVVNSNVKDIKAEENANETPVNIPVPEIKEVKPVETVEIEPDPEPVVEQVQSIQTQSVEEESDETVDTDDVSTSEEISEELSDPAVEDDSDDQEDLEDYNNQHQANDSSITVDFNGNRKKKKHRN